MLKRLIDKDGAEVLTTEAGAKALLKGGYTEAKAEKAAPAAKDERETVPDADDE